MATVTRVTRTCDVCGDAKDIQTWTFGFDSKTYEVDLCPKDGNDLGKLKAEYIPEARKATPKQSQRRGGHRQRSGDATASSDGANASGTKTASRGRVTGSRQDEAKAGRSQRAATTDDADANGPGSGQGARAGRSQRRGAGSDSGEGAKGSRSERRLAETGDADADGSGSGQDDSGSGQEGRVGRSEAADSDESASGTDTHEEKSIFVYGILPADIDVAPEMSGVGGSPLRAVRARDLAALVSDLDRSGELGSPDDLRIHREILDATAAEVPVVPLRFGTVLTSEDAVAEELLVTNRDEFAAALEQLEGRAEFLVRGRYVEEAILDEIFSENKQAARLRDTIRRHDPDAARDARSELDEIITEAVAAKREEDTQVVEEAMEGISVASIVREPTDELDAVHVAFLVAVDDEGEAEQVVDDLARGWEGWIDVELLGPVAAYDFVRTEKPEG